MANEKWLIDAEVLRHKINSFATSVVYRGNAEMFSGKDTCNPYEYTRGYERGILDAQKIVCGQDTVDAVEVVHGKWKEYKGTGYLGCSVCWDVFVEEEWLTENRWNYCPNCGAKMDGGNEDV